MSETKKTQKRPLLSPSLEKFIRKLHTDISIPDMMSRDFIFGRNYAEVRSTRLQDQKIPRTLLSFLLHEFMDSDSRKHLFPEKFDLGNYIEISAQDCKYENVLGELSVRPEHDEALDPIKDGIKRLTGKSTADFLKINKSITLKVVKTLYTITKGRSNRIFTALAAPEFGKAGLEFRMAYPNSKSRKLIYLVSDLREYLGAELPVERIIEINQTFELLQRDAENTDRQIQEILLSGSSPKYDSLISAYDRLSLSIENYRFPSPAHTLQRLDETLYTYITSLEIRHFSQQVPKIQEMGTSGLKVNSIASELVPLAKAMRPVRIKDLPAFIQSNIGQFQRLLMQALGMEIELKELVGLIPLSVTLLKRIRLFDPSPDSDRVEIEIVVSDTLAALAAIKAENLCRTNFKPYWHGQPAIGDSLLESLKTNFSDEDLYEEHLQIWRVRLNYFKHALNGHMEWYARRLKVNAQVLSRFAELASYKDTAEISRNASAFISHIGMECLALRQAF